MSKRKIAYARKNIIDPEEEGEELPFKPREIIIHTDYWFDRDYQLHDVVLGRGKFGEVKKCSEISSGLVLAAKIVAARKLKDKEDVRKEIKIMSQLHHPKILQIYDAFENSKQMCLITEIVEGGELFDRVVDENFDLTERVAILFMRQIIDGVAYIHSQNILHLDLKPENIICVAKTGTRIKIIDFGLAMRYDSFSSVKVMAGTVDFMSPEVCSYEDVTRATDMWSIGVICYVLVSGLSPFCGDDDSETICNIQTVEYDFAGEEFEEITAGCKDFIKKLLLKDPRKRMTAEECMKHSWLNKITRSQTNKHLSKKHHIKFFVRRKWKKVIKAVIAMNRLSRFLRERRAVTESEKLSVDSEALTKPTSANNDCSEMADWRQNTEEKISQNNIGKNIAPKSLGPSFSAKNVSAAATSVPVTSSMSCSSGYESSGSTKSTATIDDLSPVVKEIEPVVRDLEITESYRRQRLESVETGEKSESNDNHSILEPIPIAVQPFMHDSKGNRTSPVVHNESQKSADEQLKKSTEELHKSTGELQEFTDEQERSSIDEPERASTYGLDNASTDEPEGAPTDEKERASTDEPERASTDELERASTDEPERESTDEPERASPDEPEKASTDEPERASTDEPERASTDEPEKASTDEPERASTDELERASPDELQKLTNELQSRKSTESQLCNSTGELRLEKSLEELQSRKSKEELQELKHGLRKSTDDIPKSTKSIKTSTGEFLKSKAEHERSRVELKRSINALHTTTGDEIHRNTEKLTEASNILKTPVSNRAMFQTKTVDRTDTNLSGNIQSDSVDEEFDDSKDEQLYDRHDSYIKYCPTDTLDDLVSCITSRNNTSNSPKSDTTHHKAENVTSQNTDSDITLTHRSRTLSNRKSSYTRGEVKNLLEDQERSDSIIKEKPSLYSENDTFDSNPIGTRFSDKPDTHSPVRVSSRRSSRTGSDGIKGITSQDNSPSSISRSSSKSDILSYARGPRRRSIVEVEPDILDSPRSSNYSTRSPMRGPSPAPRYPRSSRNNSREPSLDQDLDDMTPVGKRYNWSPPPVDDFYRRQRSGHYAAPVTDDFYDLEERSIPIEMEQSPPPEYRKTSSCKPPTALSLKNFEMQFDHPPSPSSLSRTPPQRVPSFPKYCESDIDRNRPAPDSSRGVIESRLSRRLRNISGSTDSLEYSGRIRDTSPLSRGTSVERRRARIASIIGGSQESLNSDKGGVTKVHDPLARVASTGSNHSSRPTSRNNSDEPRHRRIAAILAHNTGNST